MANTITIDPLRQELWSKELMDDVQRDVTNVMRFMGTEDNNVVQVSRDLTSSKGDSEDFGLVARLASDGVAGDDELEGQEESMQSFQEQVIIDQIRNAVRLKGKLDAQKVVYDQIKKGRSNLQVWLKEFLCRQIMLKMGGVTNTGLTDTNGVVIGGRALWSNTPDFIPNADEAAGSGNRFFSANAAGDDAMVVGDKMTLDLVTEVSTRAKLANPQIQKVTGDGEDFYVMYLHPFQARDIRKSSDWKTANENGRERAESNPVFRGALGFWSNTLLLENEFTPWLNPAAFAGGSKSFRGAGGSDAAAITGIARALLCGRQACLYAEASNPEALVVEQFDYKNKDGVACSFIGGIQKPLFNSKEFGVFALDTAAA
jgi:N4-gp56 family major capsid protein